ncbi:MULTISPECIES: putative cobaltochelatase [unclassified Kitasatospora]|uniref:putative cobaltochelatase n=1 Tax=unclassified Kitasatospora TaxID=2633591 RepID=UPI00070DE458|nr:MULTISPECIES: putative cobaltochelatase [unclassified Kitasatospora]KQV03296.1 magnesium chelatase [Kitasatospora sp. Root107]KRB66121.1 magnesium chelatase [Kitasatospora sp. Root187]
MTDVRYPFTAIVGMADLRLGLLLNAVSPAVGGVLVRGEKGTAKSTMVRALAGLLPSIDTVPGCRFSCDPASPDQGCPDGPHASVDGHRRPAHLVELPVGVSEDRIVGSLDLERALAEGVKAYEPGLLAKAHRGVLYIDEVNLLQDHVVDLLLDAAAMGRSYVEREGVSVRHAARFLLVGTMNPEEGELRPQLLDRFGLTVEIAATREPDERAEVVRRRLAYDADPDGFAARFAAEERELAERITAARELLPSVVLTDVALRQITAVCAAFEVDGMRADIVMARTAIALAAWEGRTEVNEQDVRKAAQLALPHRRRRNPFDAPGLDEEQLDRTLDEHSEGPEDPDGGGPDGDGGGAPEPQGDAPDGSTAAEEPAGEPELPSQAQGGGTKAPVATAGEPYRTRLFKVPGTGKGAQGRRSPAETDGGHTIRSRRPQGQLSRLHLSATLQAAAPHQAARGRDSRALVLRKDDFREQVRQGRESNLVLFVVDASGSMAARQRMTAVKGAVLSLLMDAYQRRDKIGMITFRGSGAELALPPTSSVEVGAARLEQLPTGGRTPLAAGLLRAHETLRVERMRDPHRRPLLVVVTDGRATGGKDALPQAGRAAGLLAAQGVASVVLDCESGHVRLGLAHTLAAQLNASAVTLDDLRAEGVAALVHAHRPSSSSIRKAA